MKLRGNYKNDIRHATDPNSWAAEYSVVDLGCNLTQQMRAAGIIPRLLRDDQGALIRPGQGESLPNFALAYAVDRYLRPQLGEPFYAIKCPISRDRCEYPVQLEDGHTYDLDSALGLLPSPLGDPGFRSPVTRAPMAFPVRWQVDDRVLGLSLYEHLVDYGDFSTLPMYDDNVTLGTRGRWGVWSSTTAQLMMLSVGSGMIGFAAVYCLSHTLTAPLPRDIPQMCRRSECFNSLSPADFSDIQSQLGWDDPAAAIRNFSIIFNEACEKFVTSCIQQAGDTRPVSLWGAAGWVLSNIAAGATVLGSGRLVTRATGALLQIRKHHQETRGKLHEMNEQREKIKHRVEQALQLDLAALKRR